MSSPYSLGTSYPILSQLRAADDGDEDGDEDLPRRDAGPLCQRAEVRAARSVHVRAY